MKKVNNSEDKIIQAALNEFSTFGFAGARVDAIAEKAKVNKAMIYYHFKSKEKLYEKILLDVVSNIYNQLQEVSQEEGPALDVFYSIINKYMSIIKGFDNKIFPIMLRELIEGGKFFRKIIVPNLIEPILALIMPILNKAKEQGVIRDINPYFTFLQIVGSVVFVNVIRTTIKKSSIEKIFLEEGSVEKYNENLFTILKNGIELKGGQA